MYISLSVLKNLKTTYERKGDDEKRDELDNWIQNLPDEISKLIEDPLPSTPYDYLNEILELSSSGIIKVVEKQPRLTGVIRKVRSSVAIFIDNPGTSFSDHLRKQSDTDSFGGELSLDIWYGTQIGLMLAIWKLSRINHHLKIFASIEKEAYLRLLKTDDRGLQIKGCAFVIKYTKEELKEIFIKNIKSMNKKDLVNPGDLETDPIYSFLGLEGNKITNIRLDNKNEDIFDYIYRHTLKRPRDLMIIGNTLTAIGTNERTEENIRAAVNKAATAIAELDVLEIKPHVDFNQFDDLFDLIHSNILTKKEVREICGQFNNQENCENTNCEHCEKTHVFCNLYKIGLLGVVRKDSVTSKTVQKFLGPGDAVFESNILPLSEFYLIHPILNSLIIERNAILEGATYIINPRIIVGDGYEWKDPIIYKTTRYCSFINHVCSTDRFIDKQGVFLASSYDKKDVINELGEELKKLNSSLEIDKWVKIEGGGTGRIFCDEVCPKLFRNYWMIAEVSDFNPNVFFECGFAIGLGRAVIFLCDENADKIKSQLGKLYLSYKTIDDIINKFNSEWTPDTINNIEINSLYRVPRVFRHIDNFDSPNDREKSDEVYVLSFNQETGIIRKLSEYGYKIVGINRLMQSFMLGDLVKELIDAKAVVVNLSGVQKEQNTNKLNDSQLMCLAGICASQGVPIRIFQSNKNFYSDMDSISFADSETLIKELNALPLLDRDPRADALESKARSLIANQEYSKAKPILKQVMKLMPERNQLLQNEFGFLYDFTTSTEKDEKRWDENKELIKWWTDLWYVLSERNNFSLGSAKKTQDISYPEEKEVEENSSFIDRPVEIIDPSPHASQEKGEILEKAVLELFHQFFIIAEEDEDTILQKLRKQNKGLQFGHDISFECAVKENKNIKCHIECKNIKRDITPCVFG